MLELLRQSVLAQATMAVIVVITVCLLSVLGRPVPNELWTLLTLILGFYFGAKIENVKARKV